MIDENKLIEALEARIKSITDTMTPDMEPMIRILQSTRARVLMDVVDVIKESVIMIDIPEEFQDGYNSNQ